MNGENLVDGIAVDTESVVRFLRFAEKERWSEEDLDEFVSTKGVQYLIQQERESGPNNDEDTVKTFLEKAKQGFSGELGGWETAWKEKTSIRKRLDHISSRWNYLVAHPLSVVKDYLPERVTKEPEAGTCYFLPGGSEESYSGGGGFAINLGHGARHDADWMFLIARGAYHLWFTRAAGENPRIAECETPSEFIETFLDLTHREGMATLVGLRASGTEEQFFQENAVDSQKRSKYSRVFGMALEEEILEMNMLKEVFSGYTSLSALFGASMAKALERCGEDMGDTLRKDMLLSTVTESGFYNFFEIYAGCGKASSLPDEVWEAYEKVRKERGFDTVREGPFFFG